MVCVMCFMSYVMCYVAFYYILFVMCNHVTCCELRVLCVISDICYVSYDK